MLGLKFLNNNAAMLGLKFLNNRSQDAPNDAFRQVQQILESSFNNMIELHISSNKSEKSPVGEKPKMPESPIPEMSESPMPKFRVKFPLPSMPGFPSPRMTEFVEAA